MEAAAHSPAPKMPVGGFFESHAANGDRSAGGLLAAWTDGRPYAGFVSARAAFAALAARHPDAAIWLPAFICADLVLPHLGPRIRFYPVLDGFAADLRPVEAGARSGDIVVLVAHFGLPAPRAAQAFAKGRPDVVILEDRAQALGPGLPALGGYELYSPRKLLGVADGGILVAPRGGCSPPQPMHPAASEPLWRAPDLRANDRLGADNELWHAANQAKEAAMPSSDQAITERSLAVLQRVGRDEIASARLRNWRRLDARLRAWSALPPNLPSPPLGYVLRLDPSRREQLRAALQADRIFAAVHWPRIAAPEADFPREAAWTRELITLPCDHRYGDEEMDRIAARAEGLLA